MCSLIYPWLFTYATQNYSISVAFADVDTISYYSPAGQMAVYSASNYLIIRAIIMAILTLLLCVYLSLYYTRRRYLFSAFSDRLSDYPHCSHCGMTITDEISFCTNCGFALDGEFKNPSFKVLGDAKHCKKCGSKLTKDKLCPKCDVSKMSVSENFVKGMKIGGKEALKKTGYAFIALCIFAFIIYIPLKTNSVAYSLFNGMAVTHNAYVNILNQYLDDPSVAEDTIWLGSFNVASNALYTHSKRCFYINPNSISKSEILFYANFSEASYYKMISIEKIAEVVNSGGSSSVESLTSEFNYYDNLQDKSIADLNNSTIGYNFTDILIDGFRFYLSKLNLHYLFYALALFGFLGLTFVLVRSNNVKATRIESLLNATNVVIGKLKLKLNSHYTLANEKINVLLRIKNVITGGLFNHLLISILEAFSFIIMFSGMVFLVISIYRPSNFIHLFKLALCIPRKKETANQYILDTHFSYKLERKKSVRSTIIVTITTISLLFVIFGVVGLFTSEDELRNSMIIENAGEVLIGRSNEFMEWLNLTQSDPAEAYSNDNLIKAKEIIESQLQAISNYRKITNVEHTDTQFNDGVLSLCNDEEVYLQEFLKLINEGKPISQQEVLNYVMLRATNYSWLLNEYENKLLEKALDDIGNSFG
jgi:RNA polymerase subunit RPABC4/transcription elongation factor Spt4